MDEGADLEWRPRDEEDDDEDRQRPGAALVTRQDRARLGRLAAQSGAGRVQRKTVDIAAVKNVHVWALVNTGREHSS